MRPGSQRAPRWARRPLTALLLMLVVLGAGTAAAGAPRPDRSPRPGAGPASAQVPVASASALCPDPRARGAEVASWIAAVVPPAVPGTAARGGVELTPLPEPRSASPDGPDSLAELTTPGSLLSLAVRQPGQRPLLARAWGGLAPGFAAEQTTRSAGGRDRGLAGTACAAPGGEFWFVGAGADVGRRGRLYLTNGEASPAQVDVTLYGEDGPIAAPAGRGVTVAAHSQRVLLLDALAPGAARLAVHVDVHSGRVAAAVRDMEVHGLEPRGVDWLPPAARPARRVVVPAVPGGPGGDRVLTLLPPGQADAIVKLRVVTGDGAFIPAGLDVVEVPAGTVGRIDIGEALAGQAAALELVSDVPIVAGVRVRLGAEAELTDIGYLAAAAPLEGPAAVADNQAGGAIASTLLLTAPRSAARVSVATLSARGGSWDTAEIVVPAASTVTLPLDAPTAGERFAVVVTPVAGSGPVYAGRLLLEDGARGPLFTLRPLESAPVAVDVPVVENDISAGLPRP